MEWTTYSFHGPPAKVRPPVTDKSRPTSGRPKASAATSTADGKHEYRSMCARSSRPTPARANAQLPAAAMAGELAKSWRSVRNGTSWASPAPWRKTQRSRGTPKASACSAEHMSSAPAWSTVAFELISLVYGKATIRLSGLGVPMASAVRGVRMAANSLCRAIWLQRAHSALATATCSSRLRP